MLIDEGDLAVRERSSSRLSELVVVGVPGVSCVMMLDGDVGLIR